MDWIAVICGFAVGATVGRISVGGGSPMKPILIGIFKFNPAIAIGTDLWFPAATKSGRAVAHQRHGHVDGTLLAALLIESLPGIWLGARLTQSLPDRLIRSLLAGSLPIAALKLRH